MSQDKDMPLFSKTLGKNEKEIKQSKEWSKLKQSKTNSPFKLRQITVQEDQASCKSRSENENKVGTVVFRILPEDLESNKQSVYGKQSNAGMSNASSSNVTIRRRWTLSNSEMDKLGISPKGNRPAARTFGQLMRTNTLGLNAPWMQDEFYKSSKQTLATSNDIKSSVHQTPQEKTEQPP